MEDPSFIQQWQMNSLDEFILPPAAAFGDNLHQSFCHQTFDLKTSMETSPMIMAKPTKHLKSNSWNSCKTEYTSNPQAAAAPSPNILSFENQDYIFKAGEGAKRINTNARLSQAQDHIMAERRRREKISQRFIALSAIVPGLKKTDKASVLGDAIKYLKQLQEKVKTLEEQTRKRTMESVVFVKKSQVFADGDNSSSDENFSNCTLVEPLPEIEARICDNNILIRIHCEKMKGVLEKIVAEIEKLHLTVVNSSVMTFGNAALDITVISQMNGEFCMSVKDLVKNLRSAFELFI